ncbi:MAG: hypothetical protein AABY22_33285 [Nanoarchaeota archaeon]
MTKLMIKDLTGQKFSRLTVIKYDRYDLKYGHFWFCKCECNNKNERSVCYNSLLSGNTKSCGCLGREKTIKRNFRHGLSKTPTYKIWKGMNGRCNNPNTADYNFYGGRGITICREWAGKDGFQTFLKDMGERSNGLTLDRIDNNKNYCKENCRWANSKIQGRNKRGCNNITFNGKTQCIMAWSEEVNIPRRLISQRLLKLRWTPEEALTTPVRKKIKNLKTYQIQKNY